MDKTNYGVLIAGAMFIIMGINLIQDPVPPGILGIPGDGISIIALGAFLWVSLGVFLFLDAKESSESRHREILARIKNH